MFGRLHKRNKGKGSWCDTWSEKVVTKCNLSIKTVDCVVDSAAGVDGVGVDSPSHIPFDPKAWKKGIGDPKKKFYSH
ncbi:hypothetical protein Tco_0548117 [Tanacetum coccineum]